MERWLPITHCPRGHDYRLTGVMNGQGYRICGVCVKANARRNYLRRKAEGVSI